MTRRLSPLLLIAAVALALVAPPAAARPLGGLSFFAQDDPRVGDHRLVGECAAQTPFDHSNLGAAGAPVCAPGQGLEEAYATALSPDGTSIYVAARASDAVAAFARAPDGSLDQLGAGAGCLSPVQDEAHGTRGCGAARALAGASGVAVSPDGRHVYVSARDSDAVAVFARDPGGALSQLAGAAGCVAQGGAGGCRVATGLDYPVGMAFSADGARLYVASRASDSVTVFDRAGDGSLTQLPGGAGCTSQHPGDPARGTGAIGELACASGRALDGAYQVALSRDGASVYVTARVADGVAAFLRDPATGTLRQPPGAAGCLRQRGGDGCAVADRGLNGAAGVAVSPDGLQVYVASYASYAVSTLSREPGTGALALRSCVSDERETDRCAPARALAHAHAVAVSPDGRTVYALGRRRNAVAPSRAARTGRWSSCPTTPPPSGPTAASAGAATPESTPST